jgi:hypothetical protein
MNGSPNYFSTAPTVANFDYFWLNREQNRLFAGCFQPFYHSDT